MRYLNEVPIITNNDFLIYGNSDLELIKDDLINTLSARKAKLLEFFKLPFFRQISINLFNNHETFLKFTRQFYEPASYEKGNTANGTINYSYDPNNLEKLVNGITGQLVHLLYQQLWFGRYEKVEWLDVGLAEVLSGQKSLLEKDDEKFKVWYLNNIVRRDKIIPPFDFLNTKGCKYGCFCDDETAKYDGYDLAYLLVRYLINNYENLNDILKDKEKIKQLEKHLMTDTINYYNNYFQVENIKNNFYDVQTPKELMDYMNKNIIYGWLDKEKQKHVDNLKNFRENYVSSNIEEILTSKLGTCIEQAKLIKYFFDNKGIENKLFCLRNYETEDNFEAEVKMHCFVLYHYHDKWYHFEHSDSIHRGIYEYETIEQALQCQIATDSEKKNQVLTEIPSIPEGITFKEFNNYVNNFELIDIESSLLRKM